MNSEEIKRLVAKSENAAVEFKRARGGVPADFWPSYSSFANTDGGVIILGVREKDGKREIEGMADTEKIVADLWNAVNNQDKVSANVLFNESIYPVDVDGKAVVVVEVPRAERTVRPVFVGSDVFKGTYRRNGEGDYHCSRETVEGMIRDKCAETADNCILDELTIADLDADTIRRYRMYFSQLRPGHVWSSLADDGFLMKIGLSASATSTRSRTYSRTSSSTTANISRRTSAGRIACVPATPTGAETSSTSSSASTSRSRRE